LLWTSLNGWPPRGGAGLDPALWLPLPRLLSAGKPVGVDDLAAETGRPEEQLRQALAAVPDTEHAEDGRIVGLGLTLRPTPPTTSLSMAGGCTPGARWTP
jgi:alkylmercury lyase